MECLELLFHSRLLLAVLLLLHSASTTQGQLVVSLDDPLSEYTTAATDEPTFTFDPPNRSVLDVNTRTQVVFNVSAELARYVNFYRNSTIFVGVMFDKEDKFSTDMMSISKTHKVEYDFSRKYNASYKYPLFWQLQPNNDFNHKVYPRDDAGLHRNVFTMTVKSIGYPRLNVQIIERFANNTTDIRISETYQITAMRKHREVDLGFTVAISIVGLLNIFAIGCMTEMPVLRSQLKKSIIPVCLASGTQYIIIPLLTFGLIKLSKVLPELGVGILICACVPGGGLGHLIVVVTGNANTELSVAINFLQIFVPLATLPLWLYTLGQFLPNSVGVMEVPTHFLVLCLALLLVPYILGVIVRHVKPSISEAILNWLIKPLLLLFMILFVTLGLYINIYAMGVLDKLTLSVAGLVPSLGFCIGGGLTLVTKQGKPSAKSVGIEAAIMNCLAVIAVIKYTMPQPDADMACASAIAVLFFTPLPFIGMLIFHKIKKKILTYFENRRFEKEQQEVITKSFALITQNALQISGMTPTQVNLRRSEEVANNYDKTIITADGLELNDSVVQLDSDHRVVETVPLTKSNHRSCV